MAKLSGSRFVSQIARRDPDTAAEFRRLHDVINHMSSQLGIDPVGQASAPAAPDALDVTVTGETAHFRVTNNNPVDRATKHFVEIHTSPQFNAPVKVLPLDTSRDGEATLPTISGSGTMQDYYARAFSQKPGSPPSPTTPYPTYITMDGGTTGDVPQSKGSGTSVATGQQAAQGFGVAPTRAQTGPKRTV